MAHGGHHGGGFHGGGHHSGGFHGGGFHGGGFSGGGFSGSHYSGGHYSGGHYSGGSGDNGDDGSLGCLIYLGIRLLPVIIGGGYYFLLMIDEGEIPGLEFGNLGIFCLAAIIFAIALKQYGRTAAISDIKGRGAYRGFGHVWKGTQPVDSISDKQSWAGKYLNRYRITFYDKEFGEENVKLVKETIARTPKIIWMNSFVWLALGIISAFSTFFFYETIIPIFENMYMSDEAFAFIDELVFYFPALFALLCSIACLVFVIIKDILLWKCATRIVNNNLASDRQAKTAEAINTFLGEKWYYNICPNCGSGPFMTLTECSFCGSSLEVMSFEKGFPGAVHRVAVKVETAKENKEKKDESK